MIDAPEKFSLPKGFQLHEKSLEYIEEVKSRYEEIDTDPPFEPHFRDGFIVHLKPKKDTYNEGGTLDGFIDSLIFDATFYYPNRKEYFATTGDEVEIQRGLNTSTRIFKDGSTLIWCRQPAKAALFQSIRIKPIN